MDCLAPKVKDQSHQTQPHLKGLLSLKFEVDTPYSVLDIEVNV